MKIWVLGQIFDESSHIRGVFSSLKKAMLAKEKIIHDEKYEWLSINEFDLDKFVEFEDTY